MDTLKKRLPELENPGSKIRRRNTRIRQPVCSILQGSLRPNCRSAAQFFQRRPLLLRLGE